LRLRYRRQIDFLLRRVRPEGTLGLSLSASLVLIGLVGWAFGAVMQDVLSSASLNAVDRPVLRFFFERREPWLTTWARIVAALGSASVLVPLVVVVGVVAFLRTRSWRGLTLLVIVYAGAEGLTLMIRSFVNRSGPPAALAVSRFAGRSFPAAGAVVAVGVWGMVAALIAAAFARWSVKVGAWTAAGLIAGLAGTTRLYLGAQWFTDVAGGWALGALWLFALLLAVRTVAALRDTRVRART
jgi:undecaprenyl-diphosphatase